MHRLLLPQIQTVLAAAAETCALGIANGDEPFFKKLEWWLADGVFNQEPHGMFRTEDPYRPGDLRTVAEFLAQEPHHRWDGMNTLADLFAIHVLEMLGAWCQDYLKVRLGPSAPGEEEWENVYAPEWEDALHMADLHPQSPASIWTEFLALPLGTLVENWRSRAAEVARERRLKAARMLSRQDIEQSMVARVDAALRAGRARLEGPLDLEALLTDTARGLGEWGSTEVAIYVHSSLFAQNTERALLRRLAQRFPIPAAWERGGELAEA